MLPCNVGEYEPRQKNMIFISAKEVLMEAH